MNWNALGLALTYVLGFCMFLVGLDEIVRFLEESEFLDALAVFIFSLLLGMQVWMFYEMFKD